jgi:hypothetical protein
LKSTAVDDNSIGSNGSNGNIGGSGSNGGNVNVGGNGNSGGIVNIGGNGNSGGNGNIGTNGIFSGNGNIGGNVNVHYDDIEYEDHTDEYYDDHVTDVNEVNGVFDATTLRDNVFEATTEPADLLTTNSDIVNDEVSVFKTFLSSSMTAGWTKLECLSLKSFSG